MKRLFLLFAIALSSVIISQAYNIVLRQSGGTTVYSSNDMRSAAISTTEVSIQFADDNALTISADQFETLTFGDVSGVESNVTASKFTIEGSILIAGDGMIAIYDTEGRCCASGNNGKIDISSLSTGVYLIVTPTFNEKILLR